MVAAISTGRRSLAVLAAALVMPLSVHATPVLAPTAPFGRVATYDVTENTYPHFGLWISSAGGVFPTSPPPPFSAPLDPHLGYPDLTIWGPWVFNAAVGFEVVSEFFSLEQTVRVSGSVQHRDGGPVFSFDLVSRASDSGQKCDEKGPLSHRDGTDTFKACLNAQRLLGDVDKLVSWDAHIDAWHVPVPVPEPSLGWLLFSAALPMGLMRIRMPKR